MKTLALQYCILFCPVWMSLGGLLCTFLKIKCRGSGFVGSGHGEVRKELGRVKEGQTVIGKYFMREDSIISLKFIHSESLMAF